MQGNMGNQITEEHLVPANRTGLVIGKGGETIKQINAQSGARAQIVKDPPPNSDPNYKIFNIKGCSIDRKYFKISFSKISIDWNLSCMNY